MKSCETWFVGRNIIEKRGRVRSVRNVDLLDDLNGCRMHPEEAGSSMRFFSYSIERIPISKKKMFQPYAWINLVLSVSISCRIGHQRRQDKGLGAQKSVACLAAGTNCGSGSAPRVAAPFSVLCLLFRSTLV